jgi:hypothetical protein
MLLVQYWLFSCSLVSFIKNRIVQKRRRRRRRRRRSSSSF